MLQWPNALGILISSCGENTVYIAMSHVFLSPFEDHMQMISTDTLKSLRNLASATEMQPGKP